MDALFISFLDRAMTIAALEQAWSVA